VATQFDIVRAAVQVDARGGRYVWGAKGPKNFDCSGFTYEVGRLCGAALVHGAQNQRDQLRRARLLISVDEALRTAGALLYRIDEGPSNDHTAVSLGNGSAIEAHSTRHGIGIFSAVGRRWTHGAKYPGIRYGGQPPRPAPAPLPAVDWHALVAAVRNAKGRTYKMGANHPDVKFIQSRINQLAGRQLVVDGAFGPATHKAVVDLQRWVGLAADGVVGRNTWNVLYPGI
jgi:hypothetical protein